MCYLSQWRLVGWCVAISVTHGPGLKCPVHARRAQYKQFYFGFTYQSRVAFTTYFLVKTAGDGAVKVKKLSKTSFTKVNNNLAELLKQPVQHEKVIIRSSPAVDAFSQQALHSFQYASINHKQRFSASVRIPFSTIWPFGGLSCWVQSLAVKVQASSTPKVSRHAVALPAFEPVTSTNQNSFAMIVLSICRLVTKFNVSARQAFQLKQIKLHFWI